MMACFENAKAEGGYGVQSDGEIFKQIYERLESFEKKKEVLENFYRRKDEFEGTLNQKFPSSSYRNLLFSWKKTLQETAKLLGLDYQEDDTQEEDPQQDEEMKARLYYQLICEKERGISEENSLKRELTENKKRYAETESEIQQEKAEQKALNKEMTRIEKREEELKNICEFYNAIKKNIKRNVPKIYFDTLRQQVLSVQELLLKYFNEKEYQIKKQELLEEQQNLKKKREKCREALGVLHSIKSLSDYAKEFIRANIEHISEIFLGLHAPREFDGLRMNTQGELTALRDDVEIPLYHLSNGQKAAVILAVFFKMNLLCILRELTASFAEQNGRDAKLNGR